MRYESLERAPAWVEAVGLAELVYNLTSLAATAFEARASLKTEIEHCALSVSNHIASGFDRSTNDQYHGLLRARSASCEVGSMARLLGRFPSLEPFESQVAEIRCKADSCSALLHAWADDLHQIVAQGHGNLDPAKEEERRRQARDKRAVFEGLRQLNGQ